MSELITIAVLLYALATGTSSSPQTSGAGTVSPTVTCDTQTGPVPK